MSKGDTFENDLLKLIFNGTAITNLAQNGVSPVTDLWVSLHTADPGETGTQGTSESAYSGYTRIATTRSTGATGWSVTNNSVSPVAVIAFPTAASTSTSTITHFAVGMTSASTGGKNLYKGTVTPNINIGQNVVPRLTTGSSITED
jgi:hypothetical protein